MIIKKSVLTIAVLFCFIPLAAASPLEAGEPSRIAEPNTMARKIQRGFLNVVLSPIEISYALDAEKKTDRFPPSWLLAIGKGSFAAMGRVFVGAYEMATFMFPQNPLVEPEFAWDLLESPADE